VILPKSGKTDVDRRVWFPRIHDYGVGRLHIHELVFDLLHRQQAKFLRFFRGNLYYTAEITEITKTNRPQIPQILLRGRTTDCANITDGAKRFFWRRSTKRVEADDLQRCIQNARDEYQPCIDKWTSLMFRSVASGVRAKDPRNANQGYCRNCRNPLKRRA
jgi:hypothetical protein